MPGYVEAVGDDPLSKGRVSTLPKVTRRKRGETVCFSFIPCKSRRHRAAVNKKVVADPRIHALCTPDAMPFDVQRMNYGGFAALVDLCVRSVAGPRSSSASAPLPRAAQDRSLNFPPAPSTATVAGARAGSSAAARDPMDFSDHTAIWGELELE